MSSSQHPWFLRADEHFKLKLLQERSEVLMLGDMNSSLFLRSCSQCLSDSNVPYTTKTH